MQATARARATAGDSDMRNAKTPLPVVAVTKPTNTPINTPTIPVVRTPVYGAPRKLAGRLHWVQEGYQFGITRPPHAE